MSWIILNADARAMPLADNSVDAIVTDSPYGLEFMGKEWDKLGDKSHRHTSPERSGFGLPRYGSWFPSASTEAVEKLRQHRMAMQDWHFAWASEALRVLKPGGYLLAFGGTRTFHRLTCAIEDAGFEIRDCMMWLYGSGFPKSLDVSKAIDKAAGVKREVVGVKPGHEEFAGRKTDGHITALKNTGGGGFGRPWMDDDEKRDQYHMATAPATDTAKQWEGWGTALKPAFEPIVVARKPIEGTVAQNVQKWGTGAMNIDACRIEIDPNVDDPRLGGKGTWRTDKAAKNVYEGGYAGDIVGSSPKGRWPANLILDEEAGRLLDEQTGERKTTYIASRHQNNRSGEFLSELKHPGVQGYNDTGGASRFFYTPKASRSERGEGNDHPTVKPLDLMIYLLKLICHPKGLVLDPFAGSGSTILAADKLGLNAIGLDNDKEYPKKAKKRVFDDAPLLNFYDD